jgi:5-methylcytosine-specific restriction protein A
MPVRAPRICSCGKVVASGQRCACQRAYDAARGSSAARGYGGSWRKASAAFLALLGNERCACGCGRVANMVDHRTAPKGDMDLFWDRSNWQPFNLDCNRRKAIATEGGFGRSVASTGGRVETLAKGKETAWGPQLESAPNSVRGKFDR